VAITISAFLTVGPSRRPPLFLALHQSFPHGILKSPDPRTKVENEDAARGVEAMDVGHARRLAPLPDAFKAEATVSDFLTVVFSPVAEP
jgi:hypothetical protein